MKKIIAVFDGYRISKSTLAYAEEVAYTTNAHLVGAFLDEFIYRSYSVSEVYRQYKKNPEAVIKQLDEADNKRRDEAVRQFEQSCSKAKISYSVHRNKSIALQELKHESMFADLVIINANETFNRFRQKPPTHFIKDLLADVQCPVMVVPATYKPLDKITLLYDGTPSSIFAVKMFSYLFEEYNELPIEVFTVKSAQLDTLRLPDNRLMREFMKRHFSKAEYKVVKGDAEQQILGHLRNHKGNEMVVLGAYRRSELSRWFKTSMADILMRELDTTLFIAHNK